MHIIGTKIIKWIEARVLKTKMIINIQCRFTEMRIQGAMTDSNFFMWGMQYSGNIPKAGNFVWQCMEINKNYSQNTFIKRRAYRNVET